MGDRPPSSRLATPSHRAGPPSRTSKSTRGKLPLPKDSLPLSGSSTSEPKRRYDSTVQRTPAEIQRVFRVIGEQAAREKVKPYRGRIINWIKLTNQFDEDIIAGEFLDHPGLRGGRSQTSALLAHDEKTGAIETVNSRYRLVPAKAASSRGRGSQRKGRNPPAHVEQRPAAFRFTSQGEKIDILPEPPEALDRSFAEDTRQELRTKARSLHARLEQSNSARRVCDSVQRLIDVLSVTFDELRPGLLLSRVRSIEADRAAFDNDEARGELFADAFAVIDDVLRTAQDLLGAFPVIRYIEAERLALDLDRQPDLIPAVAKQAAAITTAAATSEVVTPKAIAALGQNDAAISSATDALLQTSLIADKVLVVGNFARAVAGKAWSELGDLGANSWQAIKDELPKGVGLLARVGPLMGLTMLIAGPVGGLAGAAPALKPLANAFKNCREPSERATIQNKKGFVKSGPKTR